MSLLHESADLDLDATTEPRRFRADTIETALANARAELGPDVEIVEAHRIRRGGVGGFFATELGVEITVNAPAADQSAAANGSIDAFPFAEYIDSSQLPISSFVHSQPSASRPTPVADEQPEPPARPVETVETVAPTGLDQLIEAATDRERIAYRPAPRSFADHLAVHLQPAAGTRPSAHSLLVSGEFVADAGDDVAQAPLTTNGVTHNLSADVASGITEPTPTTTPTTTMTGAVEAAAARVDPSDDDQVVTADASPAGWPAPEPVRPSAPVEAAGAPAQSAPAREQSSTSSDPMRLPIDLAGAVGRLVEQLSDVTPVEGSRIRSMSKLTISMTTPDGCVIEMAAELGGTDG